MEKLNMHTKDFASVYSEKLAQLFPECITEVSGENGETQQAIDFDKLKQLISTDVVEGATERYQFTWPDKKKAIRMANTPSTLTLRPYRAESANFDTTENLYIEGDNLEVLKLLRENYLGKIKIIYIDPPYNTGNDFIYNDDYSKNLYDYVSGSGQMDENGNQLVQNTESNGRFHSDWLNMIYPRLKVARDLLRNDGAIFVSIDEHEHANLLSIMFEIFGKENYIDSIVWDKKASAKGVPPRNLMVNVHEYIVAFQKSDEFKFIGEKRDPEEDGFKNPDNDPRGPWRVSNIKSTTKPIEEAFTITDPDTGRQYTNTWAFSKESLDRMIREKRILWKESLPKQKEFLYEMTNENKAIKSNWGVFDAQSTTVFLKKLLPQVHFDNPKPINLMKYLVSVSLREGILLDFFSGSGTTAQAIMETNEEDGGKRQFILVQIPDPLDSSTEAYKSGIKTICNIGEERLRRVGDMIIKKKKKKNGGDNLFSQQASFHKPDVGFRVLKLDSSNMQDVYYRPEESNETTLFEDNIKPDRTPEDLLFQVMLECNLPLSAKIETKKIAGKDVFYVNDGYLIACFDIDVNEDVIKAVAKMKPYYFIMRDSSLSSDNVADNFDQIFKAYSKDTIRRVL